MSNKFKVGDRIQIKEWKELSSNNSWNPIFFKESSGIKGTIEKGPFEGPFGDRVLVKFDEKLPLSGKIEKPIAVDTLKKITKINQQSAFLLYQI